MTDAGHRPTDGRDVEPTGGSASRPSFWRVAVQPTWLAMLALCLVAVVAFGALAKWQIDGAVESLKSVSSYNVDGPPEPLGQHLEPQRQLYERSIGAPVRFAGVLNPNDFEILPGRLQGEREGWWLIGRVHVIDDGTGRTAGLGDAPSMPVALGWAATEGEAAAARDVFAGTASGGAGSPDAAAARIFTGTLEYPQAPRIPSEENPFGIDRMSPSYLVNRWSEPVPSAYDAYVTLAVTASEPGHFEFPAGLTLEPIQRMKAPAEGELNLLNIFYAIEWIVFMGFSLYLWVQLVQRDRQRIASELAEPNLEEIEASVRREMLLALRDERRANANTTTKLRTGDNAADPVADS